MILVVVWRLAFHLVIYYTNSHNSSTNSTPSKNLPISTHLSHSKATHTTNSTFPILNPSINSPSAKTWSTAWYLHSSFPTAKSQSPCSKTFPKFPFPFPSGFVTFLQLPYRIGMFGFRHWWIWVGRFLFIILGISCPKWWVLLCRSTCFVKFVCFRIVRFHPLIGLFYFRSRWLLFVGEQLNLNDLSLLLEDFYSILAILILITFLTSHSRWYLVVP